METFNPDNTSQLTWQIGIVGNRQSSADYDDDMKRAKGAGIDAFALNIGVDGYTDTQLDYAYDSANRNGMKVFISFDFHFWPVGDAAAVGQKVKKYADRPAQLRVDNRVFVSSFAGDGLDANAVRSASGSNIFFVPNFTPWGGKTDGIDGALNWMGWPNDGNNKAPKEGKSLSHPGSSLTMVPRLTGPRQVIPSMNTSFSAKTMQNWVFPSGSLIFDRWNEVLQKGFPMIEILTWNDYGESHYIGPLKNKHTDDGASKWSNDMPHNGWLDLSKPFIAAYKNKETNVAKYIQKDQLVYWYRRNLKGLNCDSTDTTSGRSPPNPTENYFQGRPDGWQSMEDVVYVVSLLKSAGTVVVKSGGNTVTKEVPAGATLIKVDAALGKQTFTLKRGNTEVLSDTSLMDITNVCPCGLYNFNAYVGTVAAGFSDPMDSAGLASLTVGLHVTTCQPKPSLGTNPASPTQASDPPTVTDPGNGNGKACIEGTVADGQSDNYKGLCSYTCSFNYCPPGPCKCTKYGSAQSPPASNGRKGCPASGLDDSYKGLCDYTCNHGYCPSGACRYC
ncbi:murein transglycosylase [Fusarium austroafricanum]|uniref:Murein transglycosylase n=1 Tax=Fusarium austroafricanum TaxID=2364996 RepID=A0A8H4NV93_9HYPO|nr:murein transglycosylase [Fusarium austroafricanum]